LLQVLTKTWTISWKMFKFIIRVVNKQMGHLKYIGYIIVLFKKNIQSNIICLVWRV